MTQAFLVLKSTMNHFAVALCCKNGYAIVVNTSHSEESTDDDQNDPLVEKVITSKLRSPSNTEQCEVKSPSDCLNMAIIVYGSADERRKIFEKIRDVMRSYLLRHYHVIPMEVLASTLGDFLKKSELDFYSFENVEVILASWTAITGTELYKIASNGEYYKCFTCTIGNNVDKIESDLAELDIAEFTSRELLVNVMKISLKHSDYDDDIQLSWTCRETHGRHQNCETELYDDIMEQAKK